MAKTTLMAELEQLVSEARNPDTLQIDLMSSGEIVAAMNAEDIERKVLSVLGVADMSARRA